MKELEPIANPLQKRGIKVTAITVVIMMIVAFYILCTLGTAPIWCFWGALFVVPSFMPVFWAMMLTSGWGARPQKISFESWEKFTESVWLGLPVSLWFFYSSVVLKGMMFGVSLTYIPQTASVLTIIVQIITVSMIVNFPGGLIIWFAGVKPWTKNIEKPPEKPKFSKIGNLRIQVIRKRFFGIRT